MQPAGRLSSQGGDQSREHGVEHHVGKVARDLLLVAPSLGERGFQEGGLSAALRREGRAAKQQVEGTQVVFTTGPEQGCQVGLPVTAGARPGVRVVEPPDGAVGQYAPTQASVGNGIGGGQVAAYLPVRGARAGIVGRLAGIEGQGEALAFFNHQGVSVAIFRAAAPGGALFGFRVGEQQMVGDVFVSRRPLLR